MGSTRPVHGRVPSRVALRSCRKNFPAFNTDYNTVVSLVVLFLRSTTRACLGHVLGMSCVIHPIFTQINPNLFLMHLSWFLAFIISLSTINNPHITCESHENIKSCIRSQNFIKWTLKHQKSWFLNVQWGSIRFLAIKTCRQVCLTIFDQYPCYLNHVSCWSNISLIKTPWMSWNHVEMKD